MAFDTVRANKLRSGLTVLGVVIGITSIVAMTSLIRGFDASLEESLHDRAGRGYDLHLTLWHHQLRERTRVLRADEAPGPDGFDARATQVRDEYAPVRRTSNSAEVPVLPRRVACRTAVSGRARSSSSARRNFSAKARVSRCLPDGSLPVRRFIPQEGRRARQFGLPAAVWRKGARPDREDHSRRQRLVHGRGSVRQGALTWQPSAGTRMISPSFPTRPTSACSGFASCRTRAA